MTYSFDSIAQLEHSNEFARLHKKFHQFNPLKVLRVDQFEIRHSNVLAWLLDPNENHQLGNFFVKKLISRLITKVQNEEKLEGIEFLSYLYGSFSDLEVYREVKTETNRYIDLLIVSHSQNLVIIIENKFHAGESLGQLEDYLTFTRNRFGNRGYTILPVFLTLSSDAPSFADYWVLDYHDVLEIIQSHIELQREAMSEGVFDFLKYYTSILREELVQDEESIELALEIYQSNKAAIDLLYLTQHEELRRQARFQKLFEELGSVSKDEQNALQRIYEKRKKTIDFIFTIGSNVLREAFLSFVKLEEIPQELYKAHVSLPSFILPEWLDFAEALGEPEEGYWLGYGLVIWFERTWDERLKISVEVGPIPFENRKKLLSGLEKQGVSIRSSAKLEGKKYTKIFTFTTEISDWANKQEIVDGMGRLYHDLNLSSLFKKIAIAMEMMVEETEEKQLEEIKDYTHRQTLSLIPETAFKKFTNAHGISNENYQMKSRNAAFLLPIFRELEQIYGKTREKWWWHDSTFIFWYDRLRDDRLKLTLELGPLQPEKRLAIINQLEDMGLSFSLRSKQPESRYTRLFSKSKVIANWEDDEAIYDEMEKLFNDHKNQAILEMIKNLNI